MQDIQESVSLPNKTQVQRTNHECVYVSSVHMSLIWEANGEADQSKITRMAISAGQQDSNAVE